MNSFLATISKFTQNRIYGIVGTLLVLSTLIGCGMPGDDGDSYVAYSWAVGPFSFYSTDPAFSGRSFIGNNTYYKSDEGTWYMEYQSWDESLWWAEYEVYREEGKDGALFTDGSDGDDLYFEISCLSSGPSLYIWDRPYGGWVVSSGVKSEAIAVIGAKGTTEGSLPEDDENISVVTNNEKRLSIGRERGEAVGPESVRVGNAVFTITYGRIE